MATWALGLADEVGNGLTDIRAPTQLTFARNAAAQVTFPLDLEESAASDIVATLRNGLPKFRAYRDGTLVFNGQWAPMEEESTDGEQPAADLRATFRSPFDMLTRRHTVALATFTSTDAGVIAQALITAANSGGATGLRLGTTVVTQARDRTYEHKQVAEAIQELTAVDGGFDFVESFVDEGPILAAFDVVARQGEDKAAVTFEHGPGTLANVARVVRRWLPPVNYARTLGEGGLYQDASDPTSIAKYGVHGVVINTSGVVEPATLTDKAISLLRPNPIEIVEFEPDPVLAPQPWDDYWLGDTITIRSRIGSLAFQTTARINSITVDLDEEGNEASHSLTFENTTSEVS
jgi:hypothetical protein